MGALDYISDLLKFSHNSKKIKKRKPFKTVELKVRMDCQGCERKVRKALEGMKGVTEVEIERKLNKVRVSGYIDEEKVLKRVRERTGKKAEPWPYIPYEVVPHPYVPGVYDKKAPPGYVRNIAEVDPTLVLPSPIEEKLCSVCNDDNPYSCAIV